MEKNDLSCEPMDIDLSSQSVKVMDISDIDKNCDTTGEIVPVRNNFTQLSNQEYRPNSSSVKESIVKKFHINIQRQPRNLKNNFFRIIAIVVTVLVSIITYQVHNMKCCDQLNLNLLQETLSSRLYGQPAAVNLIIKTLETKANSKILFLCGGTGVGKTLTSSLLLETVEHGSNVYHYMRPTFRNSFSTELMFGLIMCRMSLIIVDDLTINDMDVKEQIKIVIEKSASLGKEIIVILIFNCKEGRVNIENRCDKSLKSKLIDSFAGINALKSYIQFEPLSDKHLRECIKYELGDKKLNYLEFNNVLKYFNVSVDGCKGVHSKLKYLIPM